MKKPIGNEAKEWGMDIFQALVVLLVLYLACWPVSINGMSMQESLFDCDQVLISRICTKVGFFDRGDIIVFDNEINGKKIKLVKRVIGLEGDNIKIKDGEVFVNDKKLVEDYAVGVTKGDISFVVPKKSVYVMGDNREHSVDSRDIGAIDTDKLTGKVLLRFFPLGEIKSFL